MQHKHKKEFLEHIFNHLRMMQDNMILLENNLDKLPFKLKPYDLIRRCIYHDLDKFKKTNIDNYYRFYYHRHIDCEETETVAQDFKNTMKKHYSINRHHADFHILTGKPFTNIDLCEMCCDMMSRTEVNYNGDCNKCFIYCKEKFFIQYPEMLKYKDRMYEIFNLLIKLKQNNN